MTHKSCRVFYFMTDTITTKPFQSQAQWSWAYATGQPFARRWSHETRGGKGKRYRRLPYKKKAYTLDDLERVALKSDSTPDEIARIAAGIPSLASFKGEQIAPGVTRIRGDLCNVHGKYGSCAAATGGEKPAPKRAAVAQHNPKGKRKPRTRGRAAKPKKTEEQRNQERDQKRTAQRQQNRDSVKQRMADADAGLSPSGFDALMTFSEGQQPTGDMAAGLASMGLAEQATDGSYRMTPTGHAVVTAANAGDYQRAMDAITRGTDNVSRRQQATDERNARRTEREQERQRARAERERRRQEARQSRGGSSGGGKKPDEAKPAPKPKRTPRRTSGGSSSGRGSGNRGPSKPNIPPMPKLPTMPKPTADERQQKNRADVKQRMAENDAGLSPSGFDTVMSFADGQQPPAQMADELVAMGLAEKNEDGTYRMTQAARTVVEAASAGNYQRAVDAIAKAREAVSKKKELRSSSLTVLKDKRGHHRWVLFSSNAYRDRDEEIVSEKALSEDCDRADKDGSYGPLRWWHVPGADIGDCDFNAMHGRILVESGTFRDERVGAIIARKAPSLQVSIGFIHPPDEPDGTGTFHHIRRFERSLVPAGKASNPFTHVLVQEQPTMATIKERLDDLVRLLGDKALAEQVIRAAETTQKSADEQGVAYKSADAPTVYTAPDGTQGVIQDGKFIALKAVEVPPVAEEKAPPEMEMDEDTGEMGEGDGLTLSPEDLNAISQSVATALAPLIGALDIETKMRGHADMVKSGVDELKTMLGGYQRQKDSESAERDIQVAALKAAVEKNDQERANLAARLAELEGDQPIATRGYRASTAADTVRKKEDGEDNSTPPQNPFSDMQEFIMGLSANGSN